MQEQGFIFGNSTGRDARSYQGWRSYHFSAANTLTLSFRQLNSYPAEERKPMLMLEWNGRLLPALAECSPLEGSRPVSD